MKNVRVIWTASALNDLDSIYEFLAHDSVSAAKKIVRKILSGTKQLQHFPESGQAQETLQGVVTGYRYIVIGNYKVIYRYVGEIIYINIIFDTRQDPSRLQNQ